MLSEMQTATHLSVNPHRVRYVLDKYKIKRRSISDAITHLYITKYGKRAFVVQENLSEKQKILKIAGVMLYWGEGSKKGSSVALANSDPKMVIIFLKFLREICGVDEKRLRIGLHHYRDHNVKRLLAFWSRTTKIPLSQFDRPFLHAKGNVNGSYRAKSEYGTVVLRYSDTRLLKLLIDWIRKYQQQVA